MIVCNVFKFIETLSERSIFPADSTNATGSAWPYPNSLSGLVSNMLQSLNTGSSSSTISLSIESTLMISLNSSGVKSGLACIINAAIPAIKGVAILVPDLLV